MEVPATGRTALTTVRRCFPARVARASASAIGRGWSVSFLLELREGGARPGAAEGHGERLVELMVGRVETHVEAVLARELLR